MRTAVAVVLVIVLVSCGGVEVLDAPLNGRAPIVIDADFGADDMMALLYLLQQGDVSVRAVTVTGTGLAHCPAGGANARAILDHLGHVDIPVACGRQEPLEGSNVFPSEWRTGADALGTQLGLAVQDTIDSGAVDLLVETIERSPQAVWLLALGPLTNVALALEKRPEITENLAGIVIMGGAIDVNGSVDPAFAAEWNIWADPVAANRVLQADVPITLVPLDATNSVPATRFFFAALSDQKATPEAELVYEFFAANPFNLQGGAFFFWDALAAVIMIDPDVAAYETRRLQVVEEAGAEHGAVIESPDGTQIRVAKSADRVRFEEGFLTALNGGVPAVVAVPRPDVIVRFNGETCRLDGPTTFTAEGGTASVGLAVINETEKSIAVVSGLHPGVSLEQMRADGSEAGTTTEAPAYWEETGLVTMFGFSMTGGTVTDRLDLAPGQHAVVCVTEENEAIVVTDLVVQPGPG